MNRPRGCRPVTSDANLEMRGPRTGGSYIPARPRTTNTLAKPVTLPTITEGAG